MYLTLLPTVMVKIWDPSSLDAQSNITVCFGAIALGVLPTAFIYFLTPSNVDKLGTDIKPIKKMKKFRKKQSVLLNGVVKRLRVKVFN